MIHHTIVGATKLIDQLNVVGTTGSTSPRYVGVIWLLFLIGPLYMIGMWFIEH
jgi:hypothetical protein